jgi:hypothetical protein
VRKNLQRIKYLFERLEKTDSMLLGETQRVSIVRQSDPPHLASADIATNITTLITSKREKLNAENMVANVHYLIMFQCTGQRI